MALKTKGDGNAGCGESGTRRLALRWYAQLSLGRDWAFTAGGACGFSHPTLLLPGWKTKCGDV